MENLNQLPSRKSPQHVDKALAELHDWHRRFPSVVEDPRIQEELSRLRGVQTSQQSRQFKNVLPVEYDNKIFRSRTEVKWAILFDKLGLKYQYEPFTLIQGRDKWLVDFLLEETLVEVKDWKIFDRPPEKVRATASQTDRNILLLGSVIRHSKNWPGDGWLGIPDKEKGRIWEPYNFLEDEKRMRFLWDQAGNFTQWRRPYCSTCDTALVKR